MSKEEDDEILFDLDWKFPPTGSRPADWSQDAWGTYDNTIIDQSATAAAIRALIQDMQDRNNPEKNG